MAIGRIGAASLRRSLSEALDVGELVDAFAREFLELYQLHDRRALLHARKEIRTEVESLKKASSHYRTEIAALVGAGVNPRLFAGEDAVFCGCQS